MDFAILQDKKEEATKTYLGMLWNLAPEKKAPTHKLDRTNYMNKVQLRDLPIGEENAALCSVF